MARHLDLGARVRRSFLAVSLVAGTMAAVAMAPQTATAAATDQLVVVDVNDASTGDFSSSSLKTINADGTKSFASPVDLPSADADGVNAFALAGSSNGNGSLARSADGNHLAVAGYHHAPGATGQVKATGPVKPKDTKTADSVDGLGIQRMVARIGNTGTVDTSTRLGTALTGSHPRGVASENGSTFYLSGNGGSTDTGVFSIALGGGTRTGVAGSVAGEATKDQTNSRNVTIAGGGLYTVSEKTNLAGLGQIGTGLPTAKSAVTRLGPKSATVDLPVPTAVVMLDANPAVDGVDTGYVSVDTNNDDINDEIRKYTSDGTTWTLNGTKAGDYPFLTARVSDNTVQMFASKGSAAPGNTIVKFDDTNGAGAASFGSDTTVATAAAGHAFRGLAFAPTGWNPGTVSSSAPTASVAHSKVSGTIGDDNNPGTTLTLADDDTDAADLTVTAESSDAAVIPESGIEVTGTGLERAVSFAPAGVGRATITFTVTDDNSNTGTAQVSYAASSTPTSASGRYLYESSDLSSAVDVGDGHAIAVSSEDNVVRLYKKDQSGRPVKTFEFTDATTGIGSSNADLESMARVNDTLYVLGSHGNNSSGEAKPARRVLFTAAIAGSGADTTLTYIGKYNGLWDALRTWDEANNNRLGFAAGQAAGVPANDPNGFNIEGFEFAPGSTSTAYLTFRAPKVTHDGKPSAVIVPVENANALVLGAGATEPQFGEPIYLDLGGRTIREIRKNGDDDYLISASKFDAGSPEWALFAWNGDPASTPVAVKNLPNPDPIRTGSWESIVSVPHPLTAGGAVTLISDSGDTTYYGDATLAASESKSFRKSYVDEFTTSSFEGYPTEPDFSPPSDLSSPTKNESSVSLAWTKVTGANGYILSRRNGSETATTQQVGDVSSALFSGLAPSTEYTFDITAVKPDGTQSEASSPLKVTTAAVPTDRPSSVRWTSRTSTSMKIAWTKKSGSAKYKIRYFPEGDKTYKYLTVGNVSSASITGLTRGKAYVFKVAAISSSGTQSPYSSSLYASTSNLRPPTNFVRTARTSTTITLSWTKAAGANGYRIGKGIGSGTRTSVEVSGGDTQTVKLTGLKAGTTYTIDIASLEGSGNSRSSYTPRISVKTSG